MNKIIKILVLGLILLITPALAEPVGHLKLTSHPKGATIYIDGVNIGVTPKTSVALSPGIHSLKLTLEGYDDYNQDFEIESRRLKVLSIYLTKTETPPVEDPEIPPEDDDDSEEKPAKKPDKKLKEKSIIKLSSADGFYLNINKTLFNLTSTHSGNGYGLIYSSLWLNPIMRMNIYNENLRLIEITLNHTRTPPKLGVLHQKQLSQPLTYEGYKSFNSYEILSTATPENIKNIHYIIRVTDKTLNLENFRLLIDGDILTEVSCEQMLNNNYTDYYFNCYTNELGLITSAERMI